MGVVIMTTLFTLASYPSCAQISNGLVEGRSGEVRSEAWNTGLPIVVCPLCCMAASLRMWSFLVKLLWISRVLFGTFLGAEDNKKLKLKPKQKEAQGEIAVNKQDVW